MEDKKTLARQQLELTRTAFHSLVEPLSPSDLKRKSVLTKRSLGAVIAHLLTSTQRSYPLLIHRARRAKAMPLVIGTASGHTLLYYLSELQAWRKTSVSFSSAYDLAHGHLLELLEDLRPDEWMLRTMFPATGKTLTIEDVFCLQVPKHFEAHAAEIRKTLVARPDE